MGELTEVTANLFSPTWSKLTVGNRIDVVVHKIVVDHQVAIGHVMPCGQVVRVVGLPLSQVEGLHAVSLLGAAVSAVGTVVDLTLDSTSHLLVHRPLVGTDVYNYVEVCAGAGLSSIGFKQIGFVPQCAVEIQPALAALHATVHKEVPVICADINQSDVAAKIRKHCPGPCTLMAGIACQPYSRGGMQKGGSDARAGTLPATIKLMHLLQCPMLVLECVAPAQSNGFVVAHVRALQETLGFYITECTFKLEEVWAANRYRWWLIASHPSLGGVKVPTYPVGSSLVVRDLVPYVRRWSTQEEQELAQQIEVSKFQEGGTHLRQYVVQSAQKLPTALHSWGGQVIACSCGCCLSGFSNDLLRDRGIYAQIVAIPGDESEVTYRHLHVVEVCILCGVPPVQSWGENARLNLAAAGQMATPMHSIWIASSIKRHLQLLLSWDHPDEPLDALHELKKQVWAESRVFYPEIPKPIDPDMKHKHEVILSDATGVSWTVQFLPGATVQQLLAAESALHSLDVARMSLLDAENATQLALDLDLTKVFAATVSAFGCSVVSVDKTMPVLPLPMDLDFEEEGEHGSTRPAGPAEVIMDKVHIANSPSLPSMHEADMSGLLNLHDTQFTTLIPPLVGDVDLCIAMRQQSIPSHVRAQILKQQGQVWGDDEIAWHLEELVRSLATKNTLVLDPLLATCWITAGSLDSVHSCLEPHDPSLLDRVISVALLDGHWTPCVWIKRAGSLDVHCWDVDGVDLNRLNRLHGLLGSAFGLSSYQVFCTRRVFGAALCGAAAVSFLASHVLLQELPPTKSSC